MVPGMNCPVLASRIVALEVAMMPEYFSLWLQRGIPTLSFLSMFPPAHPLLFNVGRATAHRATTVSCSRMRVDVNFPRSFRCMPFPSCPRPPVSLFLLGPHRENVLPSLSFASSRSPCSTSELFFVLPHRASFPPKVRPSLISYLFFLHLFWCILFYHSGVFSLIFPFR